MTAEKTNELELINSLSDAAWERIRSLALSTAKYENFVRLGSAPTPDKGELKKGVWNGLNSEDNPKSIAIDFVLLSLGCALERDNSSILMKMGESESISPRMRITFPRFIITLVDCHNNLSKNGNHFG